MGATRHRYGCRIVQQLLKKCPHSQVSELVEVLLAEAHTFACHPFGNYVIQHLAEYSTEEQQHRLIRTIEQNVGVIGKSSSGCSVINAAFNHGAAEDKVWLARAVMAEAGLMRSLATSRQGSAVAVHVVQTVKDRELEQARSCMDEDMEALKTSRFGRVVMDHLDAVVANKQASEAVAVVASTGG